MPAKLNRKAQRDRLPMAVICGFAKNPMDANNEMSRNPRMNFGNLLQRNAALFSTFAACPFEAQ